MTIHFPVMTVHYCHSAHHRRSRAGGNPLLPSFPRRRESTHLRRSRAGGNPQGHPDADLNPLSFPLEHQGGGIGCFPRPFCEAKGGRVQRSETQGVHTPNTNTHPSILSIPQIRGSDNPLTPPQPSPTQIQQSPTPHHRPTPSANGY